MPNLEKLATYHQAIMAEVCELSDHAYRMLARAGPPLGKQSRRYVEAACLSLRRLCEYVAVAVVLAHHWDGHEVGLMNWKPKELLAGVNPLSDHPMPAPLREITTTGPMEILALPVDVISLVKLYGQCSNLLHVGAPSRIIEGAFPPFDLDRMKAVTLELGKLSWAHILLMPKIERILVWDGKARKAYVAVSEDGALFQPNNLPTPNLTLYGN